MHVLTLFLTVFTFVLSSQISLRENLGSILDSTSDNFVEDLSHLAIDWLNQNKAKSDEFWEFDAVDPNQVKWKLAAQHEMDILLDSGLILGSEYIQPLSSTSTLAEMIKPSGLVEIPNSERSLDLVGPLIIRIASPQERIHFRLCTNVDGDGINLIALHSGARIRISGLQHIELDSSIRTELSPSRDYTHITWHGTPTLSVEGRNLAISSPYSLETTKSAHQIDIKVDPETQITSSFWTSYYVPSSVFPLTSISLFMGRTITSGDPANVTMLAGKMHVVSVIDIPLTLHSGGLRSNWKVSLSRDLSGRIKVIDGEKLKSPTYITVDGIANNGSLWKAVDALSQYLGAPLRAL